MPQLVSRILMPILEWVQGLAKLSASEFSQANGEKYIREHGIVGESLAPYKYYSSQKYTRNLIYKNEVFECLALGWDIGQSSPIHDHNDRLGWIYLAEGQLFVQNYRIEDKDQARKTCRVVATKAAELNAENLAYVDTEQEVHKVCNLPRFNRRAVSVHVYQQPMAECEIYSAAAGTYQRVGLSYTSEYGRLNSGVGRCAKITPKGNLS